jgi:acyl-coenzyme A synthetase/AMP-(fatty) acid ligase
LDDPSGTREKFINLSDDNKDDGSLVYRQLKKLMQSNIENLGSTQFRKFETSDERSVRVFKTGDIVKWLANGNLVLIGRKDRQIKIRGHRIALEEIEINTEQHLKVKSVAIIPRVCPGSDEMTMVAYVVPEGQNSNFILKQEEPHTIAVMGVRNKSFETELKIWLAERLPPVMVPETFVFLANLPMTNSGKTDYKTLATTFRVQDMVASSAERPPEHDLPGVEYIRKVNVQNLRIANSCDC